MSLQVSPQSPVDSVLVDRVVMPKDGWAVARGIEGERLGQIIEISPFLKKGTHADVVIPLGDFYNNEEVIVVVYEDNNDGVFNDLDLPTLDVNGRMIAVYARTGEPLPSSITEDGSGMTHSMPGMTEIVRVRYTDDGFVPKRVEVSAGTMVEFVNESSYEMWVASDLHPTHERLPTFDQFRPYKQGGIYRYVFDKPGEWSYHDHLAAAETGTIIVK